MYSLSSSEWPSSSNVVVWSSTGRDGGWHSCTWFEILVDSLVSREVLGRRSGGFFIPIKKKRSIWIPSFLRCAPDFTYCTLCGSGGLFVERRRGVVLTDSWLVWRGNCVPPSLSRSVLEEDTRSVLKSDLFVILQFGSFNNLSLRTLRPCQLNSLRPTVSDWSRSKTLKSSQKLLHCQCQFKISFFMWSPTYTRTDDFLVT